MEQEQIKNKQKLRPVLEGEFWTIGANPDLGELNGTTARDDLGDCTIGTKQGFLHQCVDHHIFRTDDGIWHLWGCIRGTAVGRVLYHWETASLTESNWRQTGEVMRVCSEAGESINDTNGEEWMQSPFVVRYDNQFYMFYGGHSTGLDAQGREVPPGDRRTECQMCLMTSPDGYHWTRHANELKQSRIFVGPGAVRDACVILIDGLWHMYYVDHHFKGAEEIPAFYVCTSIDLVDWSESRIVHYDRSADFGTGLWNTECAHVAYRSGYYYLFRTENYPQARTHVFRSGNPYDFGVGDASGYYIGMLEVAAPEIVMDEDGREFISSNHDLSGGTALCRLVWEPEE